MLLVAVYIGSDCMCVASNLRTSWPLDPSIDSDFQLIASNKAFKGVVWRCLSEGVCRVVVTVDPADLRDLATLIRLAQCHDINHEALLLRGPKLYEALIQGVRVCTDD